MKHSRSAAVRARLDHPVIDGDGHWLEPIPIFRDHLRDVAGPAITEKWITKAKDTTGYDLAPEERRRRRLHRPTWWGEPASTLDRATAMMPRLFYERLDDFGIDFCVLYTTLGLFYVSNPDEELRFTNPVRLHTALRPDFFAGTVVAGAVTKDLENA